jgi:hypothetical protein
VRFEHVHRFVDGILGKDLHAKRVYSLANATLGVIASASLAIHAIGQGLALARGRLTKHAVKQVDRLLSNQGIEVWELFAHWVPYVVGSRPAIVVALDWTDFDADGQTTLMLSLITRHDRATPVFGHEGNQGPQVAEALGELGKIEAIAGRRSRFPLAGHRSPHIARPALAALSLAGVPMEPRTPEDDADLMAHRPADSPRGRPRIGGSPRRARPRLGTGPR